jgi:alpha-galactosidase
VYDFVDTETGSDLYPRLRELVDADPDGLGRRVRVELFRRFGYFPTESSEHSAEYVPWFLHDDAQAQRFRIEIDEYLRRSEENLREWEGIKETLDAGGELELERNDELASQFIVALETGTPAELYGNVRNEGLIDGLPEDSCVEVPVRVGRDGVRPDRIGTIPPQCLALNRTFLNVAELTVRAVVEGSRDLVYQAAVLDPNTAATLPPSEIVTMVDDLIEAHRDLIPDGIRRG